MVSHSRCAKPASKPRYAARSAKRKSPSPSSRPASANHSSSERTLATALSLRSGSGATASGMESDAVSLRRRSQKSTAPATRVKIATNAQPYSKILQLPGAALFRFRARDSARGATVCEENSKTHSRCAAMSSPDLLEQLVKPGGRTRVFGVVPTINRALRLLIQCRRNF